MNTLENKVYENVASLLHFKLHHQYLAQIPAKIRRRPENALEIFIGRKEYNELCLESEVTRAGISS